LETGAYTNSQHYSLLGKELRTFLWIGLNDTSSSHESGWRVNH